jgi:hypothetical protein
MFDNIRIGIVHLLNYSNLKMFKILKAQFIKKYLDLNIFRFEKRKKNRQKTHTQPNN